MSIPSEEDTNFFPFEGYTPMATVNPGSDAPENNWFQFDALHLQQHTHNENVLTAQQSGSFHNNFITPTTAIDANHFNWIEPYPAHGVAELNIATPESTSSTREWQIPSSVVSSSSLGADSIRNKFSDSALSESDISVLC